MKRGLLQLSGVVVDLVHHVDQLPEAGGEVESPDFTMTTGGGFNAMVAAKRMGVPVAYGGVLGTGPLADVARRDLHNAGIAVIVNDQAGIDQGSCVVLVDSNGERSFISHHGAERCIVRDHLDALEAPSFDAALLTGYSLYKPQSAAVFVPWIAELGDAPVLLFDPGPTVSDIPSAVLTPVLDRADWLSLNASEARVLVGDVTPAGAARLLSAGRTGAVIRTGADGCWLAYQGTVRHIAGFAVNTIDTNGAGDTHDGVFLAALITGATPEAAAVVANAAAALSTTRMGPATSPDVQETRRFLSQFGNTAGLAWLHERAVTGGLAAHCEEELG